MKRTILSIAILAMSATAVVAQTTATPSVENFRACREYLAEHPTDTICQIDSVQVCEQDGLYRGVMAHVGDTLIHSKEVFLDADGKVARRPKITLRIRKEVEVVDPALVKAYDSVCVETQFAEKLSEGRRRDIYYYDDHGSLSRLTNGKAVARAANKDGWSLVGEGSYLFAEGCNSFSGKVGVSYTGTWWMIDLVGGPSRTIYSSNARSAGENYTALAVQSGVYAQPIKFGKYDTDRLFLGGGYGFESYKTDSKETVFADGSKRNMRSWGNYGYLHAGILYEHRFFATGHSVYCRAEWREKSLIIQNSATETKSAFELTLGFKWGIGRKKLNTHLGK